MNILRGHLIFRKKEAYVVVNTSETGVTACHHEDLDRLGVSRAEISKLNAQEFKKFSKENSIRTLPSLTNRKWPAKSEFTNIPGTIVWR